METHSLTWFIVSLSAACIVFGIVMTWFQEMGEKKAYREGIKAAKKHILEANIIDLIRYLSFHFQDYVILYPPKGIENPDMFDFGIRECYIRLDEPKDNLDFFEWLLFAHSNLQIRKTPFEGAIHIGSRIFYKHINLWTKEVDESLSLGWKLKKIYNEHTQAELIAEIQRMVENSTFGRR